MRWRLVRNEGPRVAEALKREVSAIVRETAFAVQADIIAGMTSAHSGEVYGDHQASAPGEMPAVDTSTLLGSLDVEATQGETRAVVYVDTEYAIYLENGAPGAGIEPRPFLAPALDGRSKEFQRRLRALGKRL